MNVQNPWETALPPLPSTKPTPTVSDDADEQQLRTKVLSLQQSLLRILSLIFRSYNEDRKGKNKLHEVVS